MQWRKLLVLFEPKKYAFFFKGTNFRKIKVLQSERQKTHTTAHTYTHSTHYTNKHQHQKNPAPKKRIIFVFVNCSLLKVPQCLFRSSFFVTKTRRRFFEAVVWVTELFTLNFET